MGKHDPGLRPVKHSAPGWRYVAAWCYLCDTSHPATAPCEPLQQLIEHKSKRAHR